MADNYLESKFEELQAKKAAQAKASRIKKAKSSTHIKPKFYQDDIREEIDDDRR